jgi:glucan-binding YG repeat protein
MATGGVKDSLNNYYFFETANNENVGQMTIGWKEIDGSLYCFGQDGKMIYNTVTEDGLIAGEDGKFVKVA